MQKAKHLSEALRMSWHSLYLPHHIYVYPYNIIHKIPYHTPQKDVWQMVCTVPFFLYLRFPQFSVKYIRDPLSRLLRKRVYFASGKSLEPHGEHGILPSSFFCLSFIRYHLMCKLSAFHCSLGV